MSKSKSNPVVEQPTPPAAPAPPVAPTEIFPLIDERLSRWVGPDSPYQQAARRVASLKADLASAEQVAEFEARKLAALLGRLDDAQLDQEMQRKWYDDDLRQLLVNYLPAGTLQKFKTSGAYDESIIQSIINVEIPVVQNIEDEDFAGVMVYGKLVLDPPDLWGDAVMLFLAEQWKLGARRDEDAIVTEDKLLADIRRILNIPTPEQAAAARDAAKQAARQQAKAERSARKPAAKKTSAKKSNRAKQVTFITPSGIRGIRSEAMSDRKIKVTWRKSGHTRSKEFIGTDLRDARQMAASYLGVKPRDIPIPGDIPMPAGQAEDAVTPEKSEPAQTAGNPIAEAPASEQPPAAEPSADSIARIFRGADGRWRMAYPDLSEPLYLDADGEDAARAEAAEYLATTPDRIAVSSDLIAFDPDAEPNPSTESNPSAEPNPDAMPSITSEQSPA